MKTITLYIKTLSFILCLLPVLASSQNNVSVEFLKGSWRLDSVYFDGVKYRYVEYYEVFDAKQQYCHYLYKLEKSNCDSKSDSSESYEIVNNKIFIRQYYKKYKFYSDIDKILTILILNKEHLVYQDSVGNVWYFTSVQ